VTGPGEAWLREYVIGAGPRLAATFPWAVATVRLPVWHDVHAAESRTPKACRPS
jgi:hypothetical protein